MSTDAARTEPHAAARDYAALGWRVMPLHSLSVAPDGVLACSCNNPACRGPKTSAGKHPRIKSWQVNASADVEQVDQWWSRWPLANVGVALGTGSGIVSIDLDSDAGEAVVLGLAGNEGLPATLEMVTSAGKRRLLFAIPDGLEFEPATVSVPDPAGGEAVRFQSTGAQCVMPPSLHNTGTRYAWAPGRSPADMDAAPMPGWLIARMAPAPEPVVPPTAAQNGKPHGNVPPSAVPGEVPEIVSVFNRDADWLADVLAPKGWKLAGQRGAVIDVTRPGKPGGVSATIGHHAARDGTPALHVFTGSVAELPAGHAYDKFGAFARLYHQGDTAAAIRALAATGRFGRLKRLAAKASQNGPHPTGEKVNSASAANTRWAITAGRGEPRPGITAAELLARQFDPPRFAVDGLLGEGLTVLGGKPKQGKSFLSLLIGWAIAAGQPLDGRSVNKGHVLYLALEDHERRLQQRLKYLRDGTGWDVPATLELRTAWPRAVDNGLAYLHQWLTEKNGEARLIIVDTLARFRTPQTGAGNSYAEDYEALGSLKELIDHHKASAIVVHHTRKLKSEDPLEDLSGTMALSGAADGIWILDRVRGEPTARLFATGRDQGDTTTALTFETEHKLWRLGETADGIDATGRAADPTVNRVQKCAAWLVEYLTPYAHPSNEIVAAARAAGFSFSALKEAKAMLGPKGSGKITNVNRGGDAATDWWTGIGTPPSWRLRPTDSDIPQ